MYDLARTKSVCEGGDSMDVMGGGIDSEEMIKHTVRREWEGHLVWEGEWLCTLGRKKRVGRGGVA